MAHLRAILVATIVLSCGAMALAQTPPPSPSPHAPAAASPLPSASARPAAASPSPSPGLGVSPSPSASGLPTPGATGSPAPAPSATPTQPPITVSPASAQVAVGTTSQITVGSAISPITATSSDTNVLGVAVDPSTQQVTLTGKTPGTATVTIADARGLTRSVPVRVAYYAGTVAPRITLQLTGDPASPDFVREQVAQAVRQAATLQPGAQILVSPNDVPFNSTLEQDDVASVDVPVLVQGNNYFEVDATTHVDLENVAVPRISPASLMVSDYPERLTENGTLFSSDLKHEQPSRFLYFHYNPPKQPDRRIVLRAENRSSEPAIVQFISGRGGPSPNEMDAGHRATEQFLVDVVQNQGRLITIPGNTSVNLVEQSLPAGSIVCNLLQLRVLSGGDVHLTLFAQDATQSPYVPLTSPELLQSTVKHARGIYPIPEFHFATQWNVNDDYLTLPIGQIPLPNHMQGQALAGDYGVLQSFIVNVQNPLSTPQTIAIYENPRGGRATATYLIDGVLVQSHQVPPFSRYKVRQYVIPARGFVRITIVTMPEGGSSYPLDLIFAPDDGSVAPNAPGSPIH